MKSKRYKGLRPPAFTFMGRTYEVTYPDQVAGDYLGLTNHEHHTIEVKGNQPPLEEADTLVHEIFHVLWHHMGLTGDLDDTLEERIVRAMATAMTAALQDNPKLLDYLKASLKKEA